MGHRARVEEQGRRSRSDRTIRTEHASSQCVAGVSPPQEHGFTDTVGCLVGVV